MNSRSSRDPLDQLDPVSAEAIRWFVALHEDPQDTSRLAAFAAWQEADPAHGAAYTRLQRLWGASGHLPGLHAAARTVGGPVTQRRAVLRASAMVVAGGGAALGAGRLILGRHPFADYTTDSGERRTVALSDGSRVEMSTRTALSADFDTQRRRIRLIEGEAWFQVARDPAGRPFSVEAAGTTTIARGTAFAIALTQGGAMVQVTEHSVDFSVGGTTRRISEGESCRCIDAHPGPVQRADSTLLSWREGQLVFLSRPMADVVAALDQWTAGTTIILDPALARHPVTLVIPLAEAPDALRQLGASLPMRITEISPLLRLVRGGA